MKDKIDRSTLSDNILLNMDCVNNFDYYIFINIVS